MKTTSVKRKDNKGRILKTGESQRPDGRYEFKYPGTDGKPKFVYSWKLEEHDSLPKGKRPCQSLREKEKEIMRDQMDGIDSSRKNMTLCQLYEKHNNLKANVKKSTVKGRKRLMGMLEKDKIGNMGIEKIKPSDAKEWASRMSHSYSFQTIKNAKRSLTAAFHTAINDGYVRRNPFDWKLEDVIENSTESKAPLTDGQVESLLSFIKEDSVYSRHYNAILILLNTGLRNSELCGLTVSDIDFENEFINVDHQLIKDGDGYSITPPKTENSIRQIPMSKGVSKAFRRQISDRKQLSAMKIDGHSNFLFLNDLGKPMYACLYSQAFTNIVEKYNKSHPGNELPNITPHLCRHTFCTNMANKNMAPKTLQYIMGHKNITMTLGYYAHGTSEAAKSELNRVIS